MHRRGQATLDKHCVCSISYCYNEFNVNCPMVCVSQIKWIVKKKKKEKDFQICRIIPPSTRWDTPLIPLAKADPKNTTVFATSSTLRKRWSSDVGSDSTK